MRQRLLLLFFNNIMKKYFFHIGLNLWLSSIAMPALAVDLIDVYQQATVSDPTFQEAKATRLANREALPQSIAALLPNLSATADTTGNYVKTVRAPVPDELGTFKFNSKGYTVTLTQPIINFGSLASVYQARATAKQADAVFGAAAQDLIIRVASAYFNVLLAQDDLR